TKAPTSEQEAAAACTPTPAGVGRPASTHRRNLDDSYAISTRDPSARQLTTGHCPAVPTRASQSDQLSLPSRRPPDPSTPTAMTTNDINYRRSLDMGHPSQLNSHTGRGRSARPTIPCACARREQQRRDARSAK